MYGDVPHMFVSQQSKMDKNYQNGTHVQREDNSLASTNIIPHKLALFATYEQIQPRPSTMLHLTICSRPLPIATKAVSHLNNNYKIGKTSCAPGPSSSMIQRTLTTTNDQSFLLLLHRNGLKTIYQTICFPTNLQISAPQFLL